MNEAAAGTTPAPNRTKERRAALFAVRAFHSLAFWVIQTAIVFLIYKGVRRESDRRAAIAAAIAAGETLIYAGNGFRCPLTGLAEDLGAERGSVTDIFLPRWLASNIANIYTPLFALGLLLHAKNLRARVTAAERPLAPASHHSQPELPFPHREGAGG